MSYEVLVVESAAADFALLPRDTHNHHLSWLQKNLTENPNQAGTALLGALKGFRCISQSQRIQVVYGVEDKLKQVLIVAVLLGPVNIERKIAELVERVKKVKPNKKTGLDKLFASLKK